MKKVLVIILVVVALAGLGIYKLVGSIGRAGERGDAAVAAFHRQYNAKESAAIHAAAAPAFRSSAPMEQFGPFAGMLHAKLGEWKSGERTGIHMNNQNGNQTLSLTYSSTFANGAGTEDFVFDYNGDVPLLINYNVKSPALLDTAALEAQPK